ncbi:MAG: 2-hydroxyacid dehydrogenase [Alphaproteobacteria bacterium]
MAASSRPRILRTDTEVRIGEADLAYLGTIADVVTAEARDEQTLARHAVDADLIVTSFFPTISATVIEAARNLKAIVKYGVGVDNIDVETATRRGVMVVNCPEYGADTVADHAFALLICLARKIIQIDRATKETSWVWPAPEFCGVDLSGKTLGLVGFGNIGRAMSRRAAGFGMEQIAYDPYVKPDSITEYAAPLVDFEELLGRSDFISIHCVLTPETRGLIGEAELKKMKDEAYLVDVSRGAIIDEAALVRALEEGWIAGAGMDVFPQEPLPPDYPLLGMDNVILTSHLAWYTREADERLAKECVARLLELLEGKAPRNVKNAKALGMA